MRLLHTVAFSKKLRWLTQTKVTTLKTQLYAVNACVKRSSQRSLNLLSLQQFDALITLIQAGNHHGN
jgi:hypothetical protein